MVSGPQKTRIKLVQLSIGGNDLGFSDVIKDCIKTYLLQVTAYCSKNWDTTSREFECWNTPGNGAQGMYLQPIT